MYPMLCSGVGAYSASQASPLTYLLQQERVHVLDEYKMEKDIIVNLRPNSGNRRSVEE